MRKSAEDATVVSLLTTRDVTELVKVDKSTIYRMAENGRIPAIKVGRQWRFPEDRLLAWLGRRTGEAAGVPVTATVALEDLISPQSAQALTNLFGGLLGVMVLVTDMSGRPLAEAGNPCGLFAAVHGYPGVMEHCISGWREMAEEPDLEPRWRPTALGFLCSRALVRVGNELKGMVMAGGVAPPDWPPEPAEVEHLAGSVGVPANLIRLHLDEVYSLTPAEQERVLRLLPQLGTLISRLAADRAPAPPPPAPRRSDSMAEVARREQ